MNATYGRTSGTSLNTTNLQASLESRLRANLEGNGSPEYVLTWKHWDMLLGVPICALRASTPRTSGRGCSGWPTPLTSDHMRTPKLKLKKDRLNRDPNCMGSYRLELPDVAQLVGWPTPRSEDSQSSGARVSRGVADTLTAVARLAGWSTPQVADAHKVTVRSKQDNLVKQIIGGAEPQSPVATERRGVLHPDLPRWLMGYPPEWCVSAVTAMQSSRN